MASFLRDRKAFRLGGISSAACQKNPMRSHYVLLSVAAGLPVWIVAFFGAYLDVLQPPMIEDFLAFLTAVVLFPILEEIVFRGLLWDLWDYIKFDKNSYRGKLAFKNCCISACFSVLHIFNFGILGGLLVFIPSLWLGWLKARSGSIKTCCLVHVLWNSGFVAAFLLGDIFVLN